MAATDMFMFVTIFSFGVTSGEVLVNEVSMSLIKYINEIGATSRGSCLCEPCEECICTVNKARYVTDASWAAIAFQEFKEIDEKAKTSGESKWPDSPLELTQPPGHPFLKTISGNFEPLLHLKRYPEISVLKTTRFLLYDHYAFRLKANVIHYNEEKSIEALPVYEKMFIVIHGWLGSPSEDDFVELRKALHEYKRYINPAVLMVNWRQGAEFNQNTCFKAAKFSCVYNNAAANAVLVGRQVGLMCHLLVSRGHIEANQIHIIGYSLGAQVAHFAAKWYTTIREHTEDNSAVFNLIGRITALDPAARHFQGYDGAHITKDDASFVDVIHTSSVREGGSVIDTLYGLFGMSISVGSIDFFPNGGQKQPVCLNVKGADMTCDHRSAIKYFTESLLIDTNRQELKSIPCESWAELPSCIQRMAQYENPPVSSMGIDAQDYIGYGDHVLRYTKKASRVKREGDNDTSFVGSIERTKRDTGRIPVAPDGLHHLDHPSCGMFAPRKGRVYKSRRAYLGEFPWAVGFLRADNLLMDGTLFPSVAKGDMLPSICTGSILSDRWILTAAHCFELERSDTEFLIILGMTRVRHVPNPGDYYRWRLVKRSYPSDPNPLITFYNNPGYRLNRCSIYHDIALIRLDPPLILPGEIYANEAINRICFHTIPAFGEGIQYRFSGFGRIVQNPVAPNYWLNTYDATRLTQDECTQLKHGIDYTQVWCGANNIPPYPQICKGDSGGPAVVYHSISHVDKPFRMRAFQVGVARAADPCTEDRLRPVIINGKLSVRATRADFIGIADHYDWIVETMKNN